MHKLPQMASISDLKNRHLEIFAKLAAGPVVLANRSQPAAVLLSPEQWNQIVEELDDYWCAIEALKAELALARGETRLVEMTDDELAEWLAEDEKVFA